MFCDKRLLETLALIIGHILLSDLEGGQRGLQDRLCM